MPTLEQAKILKEFVEEIFELSKDVWASQSRAKAKNQAEITETEFLTLDLLSKSQPLTVGRIQKHIGVLPAQMSRIVRSLENKGDEPLIECKINPDRFSLKSLKTFRELYPNGRNYVISPVIVEPYKIKYDKYLVEFIGNVDNLS